METAEKTLDEILTLAAAHFKVPREKLSPDDDFFKALGIDSLQTLDLLTKLENHFHVELPDYELQGVTDFRTLGGQDSGPLVAQFPVLVSAMPFVDPEVDSQLRQVMN